MVYPELKQFVDGQWLIGSSGRVHSVVNPADQTILGELSLAGADDVDRAVAAAYRASAGWRRTPSAERARLLQRVGALMRERSGEIAWLISHELGKPITEARREVVTAAEMFEWAAEEGRRSYGRIIPSRTFGATQMAVLEPIGPVAAFSGWNAPAITPSRKISSALAAGCTIVLKPSEETPAVALAIARAIQDAGIPPGVVNIVVGEAKTVADRLLSSDAIKAISFTGATSIGKSLGAAAATSMKRATLELGGHAPALVFGDVDVDSVAAAAAAAKYRNAGQICTSPTRFYVAESIFTQFCQAFSAAASGLRVGDPLAEETQMGPMKNERRRQAIERLVHDASVRGGRRLFGGKRGTGAGYFYEPTAFANVPDDSLLATEEPFGPLAMINPFSSLEEALFSANRLPFGLAAYAFTNDLHTAQRLSSDIESGVVCINDWQASLPETPFGGVKDSGLGTEGGVEGLREFQRVKYVKVGGPPTR